MVDSLVSVPTCNGVGECCTGRVEYVGLSTYDIVRLLSDDFIRKEVGAITTIDLFSMNILQKWIHPDTGMPICNIQYNNGPCLFFEDGIVINGSRSGRCLLSKDHRPTQCLLRPVQDFISGVADNSLCHCCMQNSNSKNIACRKSSILNFAKKHGIESMYSEQSKYMSSISKISDLAIRDHMVGYVSSEILFNFDCVSDADIDNVLEVEKRRKSAGFYVDHAVSMAIEFSRSIGNV